MEMLNTEHYIEHNSWVQKFRIAYLFSEVQWSEQYFSNHVQLNIYI